MPDREEGTSSPLLLGAASAVLRGESVDWTALDAAAKGSGERAALARLQSIACMVEQQVSGTGTLEGSATVESPGRSTWGPFELRRTLGTGGFGAVFVGYDPHLDTEVALKLIPEDAGPGPIAPRSIEEGRLLARVRHPNVVTVYGASRHDGCVGIWMELVRGRTLHDIVTQGGPLGAHEAAVVGNELCRALAAVHAAGLVHRDVKAQNVMRADGGRIVLLDLGAGIDLSKCAPDAVRVVGTPLYMAPELLGGAAPTVVSDIYAAGVLLYFLVTGSYPVETGATVADLRAAHETRRLMPLLSRRPDLDESFVEVVERCLAPDPAARFASAAELGRALGRVIAAENSGPGEAERPRRGAGGRARALAFVSAIALLVAVAVALVPRWSRSPRITSIAVLPLRNVSGDPAQDFFAEGLTEALIDDLARIRALRVLSRTSAVRIAQSDRPLVEVARELGVDAVLEGTVARNGDRVRVSTRLVEAATDSSVWGASYDRPTTDLLVVQAEVAREIADRVRGDVTPEERSRMAAPRPVDPIAYELYLKGRQQMTLGTEASYREALDLFGRAVSRDSSYALAHVGVAEAWYELSSLYLPPHEAIPKARAAAERALSLEPDSAEAVTILGVISMVYDFDWAAAEARFRRSLELAPGAGSIHYRYGTYLMLMGRPEMALAELRHGRELDPLAPMLGLIALKPYFYAPPGARQYDRALDGTKRLLAEFPDYQAAVSFLGQLHVASGRPADAIAPFRRALEISENPYAWGDLGHALAAAGQRDEAVSILRELERRAARGYVFPFSAVLLHAGLGDAEAAIAGLEEMLVRRDEALLYALRDPRLDPLRGHPRFVAIVRRLAFPD